MSISEIILAAVGGIFAGFTFGFLTGLFWAGAHRDPTPKPDWCERRLS